MGVQRDTASCLRCTDIIPNKLCPRFFCIGVALRNNRPCRCGVQFDKDDFLIAVGMSLSTKALPNFDFERDVLL